MASRDASPPNFNPSRKADPTLQGKTIIVTGAASGIGAATAALVSSHGAEVISVDINMPGAPVGRFIQADLADRSSIDRLVAALPSGAHGLANIAGLPPTRPAEAVLKVNLVGLKYLTTQLVPKLSDGASIVNLASLAGLGWAESRTQCSRAPAWISTGFPHSASSTALQAAEATSSRRKL